MVFETSVSTKAEPHYPAENPKELLHEKFEVFTAVKIQVDVFWFVTQCNFTEKMEAARLSETLVSYRNPQHYTASQPRRFGIELTCICFCTLH
jgi:hypothetical protein